MSYINMKEWDVATVTAGDYSIDMKITDSMVRHFRDDVYPQYKDESFGFALKRHLTHELEDKLTNQMPNQGFDDKLDRVRVADI
jgi:hypothetical protein